METQEKLVQVRVPEETREDIRRFVKQGGYRQWGFIKMLVDQYKAKQEKKQDENI